MRLTKKAMKARGGSIALPLKTKPPKTKSIARGGYVLQPPVKNVTIKTKPKAKGAVF